MKSIHGHDSLCKKILEYTKKSIVTGVQKLARDCRGKYRREEWILQGSMEIIRAEGNIS